MLSGISIAIEGFSFTEGRDIKEFILEHGGSIASFVNSKTNFVICDHDSVSIKKSQKFRKAGQLNIPLVTLFFLFDSVFMNQLLDYKDYPVLQYNGLPGTKQNNYVDRNELLNYFTENVSDFSSLFLSHFKEIITFQGRRVNNMKKNNLPYIIQLFLKEEENLGELQLLPLLKKWLKEPPLTMLSPLGFKLHVLYVIKVLLEANFQEIDKKLVESKLIDEVVLFLHEKPNASVFHNVITCIITGIFESHHFFIQTYLIKDFNLLHFIVVHWNDDIHNNHLRGHLALIAAAINQMAGYRWTLKKLLEQFSDWREFTEEKLVLFKEKERGENNNYPTPKEQPRPGSKLVIDV